LADNERLLVENLAIFKVKHFLSFATAIAFSQNLNSNGWIGRWLCGFYTPRQPTNEFLSPPAIRERSRMLSTWLGVLGFFYHGSKTV
jgi:hypothetical protein